MKKSHIYLLGLLALLLAACSGDNQAAPSDIPSVSPNSTVPNQSIISSVAECTAQSQKLADIVEPDDHVTGVLEGYSVTLLEYGDYQ